MPDFWSEYYKNQEEERKRLLSVSTPRPRLDIGPVIEETKKPGWTPYTSDKVPMFPGAPEGFWMPTSVADAFQEAIKTAPDPDEAETRLKSAYLLSQTYNIPLPTAINDFDAITQSLYQKALAPKTAWEAIKTTWQAATIGTQIADKANQLWKKGRDWDFFNDPLWGEIQQLQAQMPAQDAIKRSLPVEALKRLAQFVPSMQEGIKAGALGNLAGSAAGALIGAMLIPGLDVPLVGITALGGLGMLAAQAAITTLGGQLGSMIQSGQRSKEMELGSEFYNMLSYRDPVTGGHLNPKIAWDWAGIYGALAGAVESMEIGTFFNQFPNLGEMAQKALQKSAGKVMTDASEQAARAGIVQRHFLSWIGTAAKKAWEAGGDVLAETAEETIQQALQIVSEETAKKITMGVDNTQLTYATKEEIVKSLVDTATTTFLGMSAMKLIPGAVKLFVNAATEAGDTKTEIRTAPKTSKSETLSTQTYEAFSKLASGELPQGLTFGRTEQVPGERYTFKLGDSNKKRLESATVDISPSTEESKPGTVTILGFEKGQNPKNMRALTLKIASLFPGWEIKIEDKTTAAQALARWMTENNPRGSEAGINPFSTIRDIPEQASMQAVEEAIRANKPSWGETEIRASTYFFTKVAQRIGMNPDEMAAQILHPQVIAGMVPDDPATFGAITRTGYEGSLKSIIQLGPNANPSTVMHELTHATLWFLQENRNIPQIDSFLTEAEAAFGIKNKDWRAEWSGWTEEYQNTAGKNANRSGEEALAYALEDYLAFGRAPSQQTEGILAKLGQMIIDLYNGLKRARVNLSPEITQFFDKIMQESPVAQEMQMETEKEATGNTLDEVAKKGPQEEPQQKPEENIEPPTQNPVAVAQQQPEENKPAEQFDIFQGEINRRRADNTSSLVIAKKLEQEGVGQEEIHAQTGWQKIRGNWMHDPLFQGIHAYHGSGAAFDYFDSDYMGTGEGAQAYGWGHYFTTNEAIARGYAIRSAQSNTETHVRFGDAEFINSNNGWETTEGVPASPEEEIALTAFEYENNWKDGIALLKRIKSGESKFPVLSDATPEEIDAAIDLLEENPIQKLSGRNLYKVHINPNGEDVWIDWNKPVPESIVQQVRAQAEKEGIELPEGIDTTNGRSFYRSLLSGEEDIPEADRSVSEFLDRAGVTGIRYPAASGGFGSGESGTNYVVFDENKIKIERHELFQGRAPSTLDEAGVTGVVMPTTEDQKPQLLHEIDAKILNHELYQGIQDEHGWIYKSEEIIRQKLQGAQPGRQILKMLQAAGVKQDEIKWTGLNDALDTDEKLSQGDILKILNENKLKINEIVYGPGEGTRYMGYALTGGYNYREILFTLPVKRIEWGIPDNATWIESDGWFKLVQNDPAGNYLHDITGWRRSKEDAIAEYRKTTSDAMTMASAYRSRHWDEPNIISHARVDDRELPNGQKMLFIEEIQSDWHQEGRRKGYKTPLDTTGWTAKLQDLQRENDAKFFFGDEGPDIIHYKAWVIYDKEGRAQGREIPEDMAKTPQEALRMYSNNYHSTDDRVPQAPFSKTWPEFVFRRLLRMAVDDGYQSIGWTTGEQQADRYNLSSYINSIRYFPHNGLFDIVASDKYYEDVYRENGVTVARLEELLGKEIAGKIARGEGQPYKSLAIPPDTPREGKKLSGLDLKIGGEGMKGFYDKILVDYANKYGKQWGAKVEDIQIETGPVLLPNIESGGVDRAEEALRIADATEENGITVHSMQITDAMRKSVGEGQYLFQGFNGPKFEGNYNTGKAIEKLLEQKDGYVEQAAFVPGIGDVIIPWGREGTEEKEYSDGYGISKILKKHEKTDNVLANLAEILERGKVSDDPNYPGKKWVVLWPYRAVIAMDRYGENTPWLVTTYIPEGWRNREAPAGLPSLGPRTPLGQEGDSLAPASSPPQSVPRKKYIVKIKRPNNPLAQGIVTYHGSGAGFSKFDLAYVGTGEGQQIYGYGLYSTESLKVARGQYADRLGSEPILRTVIADISVDNVPEIANMFDELQNEGRPEFSLKKNEIALKIATTLFMEKLKAEISRQGADFPILNKQEQDAFSDSSLADSNTMENVVNHSKKLEPLIFQALADTLKEFEYRKGLDEQGEIQCKFIESLADMIKDAQAEDDAGVILSGGHFIYQNEIMLRGDNPGDVSGKGLPDGWYKPIQKLDIEKLRDEYKKWIDEEWGYSEFLLFLDAHDVYLYWYARSSDKSNNEIIRLMGETIEDLDKYPIETLGNYKNTGEGLYNYLKDNMFKGNDKALKKYLRRAGVTDIIPEIPRPSDNINTPLRNTLIRWNAPLYVDQIDALWRYIDARLQEAGDDEQKKRKWQDLFSTLYMMETSALYHMDLDDEQTTGEALYTSLANRLNEWEWIDRNGIKIGKGNGARIASDLLYQAGFDGIQYPVAYLTGGKGEKGWNYVIFDDDAIAIKKRTLYQGMAEEPDLIRDEARRMIDEGKSYDDFVSFLDSGLADNWGIPDLPPDQKKAWYKQQWEAALTPQTEPDLATWAKSLVENDNAKLRMFLQAIYDEVITKQDVRPLAGDDQEEILLKQQESEKAYNLRQEIAEPIIAGALAIGTGSKPLSRQFLASVYGIIKANPESYARIYGEVTGDKAIGELGKKLEAARFDTIEDPRLDATMGISERRRIAEQIKDERLSRAIRLGNFAADEETRDYVRRVENELAASKKKIAELDKDVAAAETRVDYQTKTIGALRAENRKTDAEIEKIQARITRYLDNNAAIPPQLESQRKSIMQKRDAIRQKLVEASDWMEIEQQLKDAQRRYDNADLRIAEAHARGENASQDAVTARSEARAEIASLKTKLAEANSFRNSTDVQTYLAKLEERTKLQDQYREQQAEQRALRTMRQYRKQLINQIQRPAAKSANVKYKVAIRDIQELVNIKYPKNPGQAEGAIAYANNLKAKILADPAIAQLVPEQTLSDIIGTSMAKLPLHQIEMLNSAIQALRRTGSEVQAGLVEQRAIKASARRELIGDKIVSMPGYKQEEGTDTTKKLSDRLSEKVRTIDYAFKTAYRQLRDMDGGVDGVNVEFAWNEMNRHYRDKMQWVKQRQETILNAIKNSGADPQDWYDQVVTVPGAGKENGDATLRKSDLMALALAFRNEDSRQAMLYGNFFSERERTEWRDVAKTNPEIALAMAEAAGAKKFALLTEAIKSTLGEADWNILNTVFEKDGQETAARLAPIVADMTNKDLIIVDHYFPLLRRGVGNEKLAEQVAGEINQRTAGLRTPPENGFTKERIHMKPWNQNPVEMDLLTTWLKSIERQEQYIHFAQYGRELDAVYLDDLLQEQIRGKFGDAGVRYIKDYIAEVKNPSEIDRGNMGETAIRFMRGNLGAAYLAYRTSSVLKQIVTSPWPALPYAGFRLFTEAAKMMANPVQYLKETESLSQILQNRNFDMIYDAVKTANVSSSIGKFIKNAEELGMKGLEYADRFSVAIGWRAVYEKALEEFDGDQTKAIEKADQMVMTTQPMQRGVDLAPAYRYKNAATQIVLQFTQALNVVYQNLRYDLPAAIKAHDMQTAVGIAVAYIISGTLLQAMTSNPPKPEDDDPKKAAARWAFYAISQATDSVPLIGQMMTRIAKRAITGDKTMKFSDDALPGIAQVMDGMYSLAGQDVDAALVSFAEGLGTLTGAPVNAIKDATRMISGDIGAAVGRPRKSQ
jgi:hypothetical protein